jgi:hypothetical protein
MTLARINLQEQVSAAWELMAAILQPALWMLLLVAFVLASAHLLTMLGTRWGDRRVSTKALFFSIVVHLSLGLGVVAMIPEYRQHILSLGLDAPAPIEVELDPVAPELPDTLASAETPVWNRMPTTTPRDVARSVPDDVPRPLPPANERRSPIQLADVRPVERPRLPDAPEIEPEPAPQPDPIAPSPAPAPSELTEELPTAVARADVTLEPRTIERTQPAAEMQPSELTGRPLDLEAVTQRLPEPNPEESIASLESPTRMELPQISNPFETTPQISVPAPEPLPRIEPLGTPQDVGVAGRAEEVVRPSTPPRSRSSARPGDAGESVERFEPGLLALNRDVAARDLEQSSPLPRVDPDLPELFRPEADPAQAATVGRARSPASFRLRTDQDRKDEAILKHGGNDDSQKAVERALAWLASIQEADGRWMPSRYGAGQGPTETDTTAQGREKAGIKADTGVSALIILAFLGNGNTLSEGPYSANVERAIDWLISRQAANGSLAGDATVFEAMYCHGMATLALAEAYAMESDAVSRTKLRAPLEKALAFSSTAQLEDGGWRYLPRQLRGGDMSMFGWQLMAFRSAQDAGLPINTTVRDGMIRFLRDRGEGASGGLAAYRLEDEPSPAMTAEALACKQMLGLKRDNPQSTEAINYLLQNRPRLAQINLYYWYYGTLALFQHGGREWEQWNASLRDTLVSEQVTQGDFAGSWEARDSWGRYGGRLYATALSTLCLEIYYRRLPMYQWSQPAATTR